LRRTQAEWAFERALELLDLTIAEPRWRGRVRARFGLLLPGGSEKDGSLWVVRREPRTILALLAMLLLAGCSTIVADPAETAKWQLLANQATAHFRVAPVSVQPRSVPCAEGSRLPPGLSR